MDEIRSGVTPTSLNDLGIPISRDNYRLAKIMLIL